jgi:hypothetical protein
MYHLLAVPPDISVISKIILFTGSSELARMLLPKYA